MLDDWILFFVDWTAKKWFDRPRSYHSIGLPSNILKEQKDEKDKKDEMK